MDGVLLRAKPAGVTSHDVVAEVRRSLPRGPKVGHAGTLDPFATGLLLVLVGRATRAQRFLMALPKTYRAVARLGWTSSTGDRDGELAETGRIPDRLAHDGERAEFEIECSSGTYVRTLVTELGDAYCEELERTAIGAFRLEDADRDRLVPLREALAFLPERALSADEARAVSHGRSVPAAAQAGTDAAAATAGGEHFRLTFEGELVAIGEPRAAELKPVVVFAPA
jgi:tRNA pseudouridine55 synthase